MFITCLQNITGKLTPAITHGQKESILFALASSRAPALYGFVNSEATDMCEGLPSCRGPSLPPSEVVCSREGDNSGEEKERR